MNAVMETTMLLTPVILVVQFVTISFVMNWKILPWTVTHVIVWTDSTKVGFKLCFINYSLLDMFDR